MQAILCSWFTSNQEVTRQLRKLPTRLMLKKLLSTFTWVFNNKQVRTREALPKTCYSSNRKCLRRALVLTWFLRTPLQTSSSKLSSTVCVESPSQEEKNKSWQLEDSMSWVIALLPFQTVDSATSTLLTKNAPNKCRLGKAFLKWCLRFTRTGEVFHQLKGIWWLKPVSFSTKSPDSKGWLSRTTPWSTHAIV